MEGKLKILFVEDVKTDAELIWRTIEKSGIVFDKLLIDNKKEFLSGLKIFSPDLILSDYSLPQFDGMSALLLRNELSPLVPFILVTGSINEEVAVECMKAGADDYVLKDNLSRLGPSIINSLNKIELLKKKNYSENALRDSEERYRLLVDKSPDTIAIHSEGKLVFLNPAGAKLIGANSLEDLIGRSILDIVHPDSRSNFINRMRQVAEGIEAPLFEEKFVKLDGTVIDVEVIGIPVPLHGHLAIQVIVRDITKRKQVENELMRSRLLLKSSIESPKDIIILSIDKEYKYMYFNTYHKKVMVGAYGKNVELGMNLLDCITNDDDRKKSKINYDRALAGANHITIEEYGDLERSYYETRYNTIFDENNEIIGATAFSSDITQRILAQKALSESEDKYRSIFENVQDLYYESTIDGTILEVSPSITLLSKGQYNREDLIGRSMVEFYSFPEERILLMEALQSTGSFTDYEITLRNKDGSLIPCSISSKISFDIAGRPEKIIGSMRDISTRKRAEEALKHSHEFSESLLKTIPFGMDIVDETGTIMFQSENFKMMFGEDAIGKKCWELYRDDKKQCSDCPLTRGIKIGETEVYESHGVLGNRIFDISHTGMMYHGKKAMLEIFQDITERKDKEIELIRAKENAEESDKLKTAFLHNISHEIRTPLNAIVGFSALLDEADVDASTRHSYIEMIMKSSDHLLAIISDIIDISNIEANIIRVGRNEININSIIRSLNEQFLLKAVEKNISLIAEPGLTDRESGIMGDSTKLTQIISNLLNNALKFTQHGTVKFGYTLKGKMVEFFVSDTGLGIEEKFHRKIFERFYQVENPVSKLYEGTGLGLSICKGYVERMGGEMRLLSEPGVGSTFYFTIPYEKPAKKSPEAPAATDNKDFAFKGKRKILVAEDIDSNYKLVTYFLMGANAEVLRALNGKEAVEKCLSDPTIDLIFMDIKMPVMDGYTAVKILREANITIPIVAQTAYTDDRDKAIACGCNGFISKPFDKKGLLHVLSEFI
jgi:PAS domain S-box-containing protein